MISKIFFGHEVIYDDLDDDYNSTFQDYDIEDGARLSIETKDITVPDIIREIEQMNDITIRDSINVNYINEDKDPLHIVELHLSNSNIRILPISFCYLKIQNNLSLQDNQLTSLPEPFGLIKIGGHIRLHHNQLTSLPESFSSINVEGSLYLNHNQLTSLPESFGSIQVGNDLYLNHNQLTSLPESFTNSGRNDLYLSNNLIITRIIWFNSSW